MMTIEFHVFFLSMMPIVLQQQVAMALNRDIVANMRLFYGINECMIDYITNVLTYRICVPQLKLFTPGNII